MKAVHRPPAARWRILLAIIVAGLAIVLAVPGVALAVFSAAPAVSAGATAATISPASGFTAVANNATQVTLSWTAPPTLTGYTLTQSTGTLSGCSATPAASTTTCTATGLSAKTTYTWTLTAVYGNWKSTTVQVSATTKLHRNQRALGLRYG